MARGSPVALSYGELRPQVFHSRVGTDPVAWSILFKRAYHTGQASRNVRMPGQAKMAGAGANAQAMANGSAAIGAGTGGRAAPDQAPGTVGLPTTDAQLRLYVPQRELAAYRPSPAPFGGHDVIFHSPTIFERLRAMLGLDR